MDVENDVQKLRRRIKQLESGKTTYFSYRSYKHERKLSVHVKKKSRTPEGGFIFLYADVLATTPRIATQKTVRHATK